MASPSRQNRPISALIHSEPKVKSRTVQVNRQPPQLPSKTSFIPVHPPGHYFRCCCYEAIVHATPRFRVSDRLVQRSICCRDRSDEREVGGAIGDDASVLRQPLARQADLKG